MTSRILRLSNKRQAHCQERGQGEPLVLIHGVGMQAEAWHPQIEALASDYHVISVDMPGHGQSSPLLPKAALPDFVNWAIEVIETLAVGPVNLAGHSMGSLIATGVTVTRPDLVRRVAVLNSVYRRSPQARQAVVARAAKLHTGSFDLETPLRRWFGAEASQQAAAREVESWLKAVDKRGYATAYAAFATGDDIYADGWPAIACPALVLTGSDDPNSTPDMARQMAAAAPHGTAVVIENQRHMVNLTAPQAVNRALRSWLATAPRPAP